MLGIVLKLDHVEMAVIGAHKVRLCPSAHAPHVLDGFNGHRVVILSLDQPTTKNLSIHGSGAVSLATVMYPCPQRADSDCFLGHMVLKALTWSSQYSFSLFALCSHCRGLHRRPARQATHRGRRPESSVSQSH